jgi:methyl-accepting chemotaxis protein
MPYEQQAMIAYSAEEVDRLSAEVVALHNEWQIARRDAKEAATQAKEAKEEFEAAVEKLKKARANRGPVAITATTARSEWP